MHILNVTFGGLGTGLSCACAWEWTYWVHVWCDVSRSSQPVFLSATVEYLFLEVNA
jgi:hypothetical protein